MVVDNTLNATGFLTGNLVLDLAITAWAAAQVLKVLVVVVLERRLDWHYLLTSGGMPSSHSSTVCACATALGRLYGWSSPLFALGAILAVIVMYDASNVRRAAGEQAKILNYMMENWTQMRPALFGQELKELLGHTPKQVFFGALLGIAIGWCGAGLRV